MVEPCARPYSAQVRRFDAEASKRTSSAVRPLSARLEGWSAPSKNSGIAEVLATSCRELKAELPPELRCPEAAILQLAPGTKLRNCRSNSCCWRWVATRLLDECVSATGRATEMRRVLEEELGDSILQQFLNLETEHEVLQARLNEERHELGTERALRSSLEEQLADMQVRLKEAQEHAATMDSAARRAISAKHKEEATVKDLREELERLMRNSPEVLRRRTAQAEAEVERIRAETEKITEKHKKDMLDERDQKTKLFIKLKELQAMEALIAKKNAKKRRQKKK